VLDIASAHHPPTSDTYALDPSQEEIPLNVYNCMYIFKSPVAPPPPPPPPPPSRIAKLYVDPPEIIDPTMKPSSSFSINITIENVTNLRSLEFNLTYNSDVISWIGMFTIKVQNQTPIVEIIINDKSGFLWINLQYPESITTSFPQPLVKINFHVNSFGITTLDLHDSQLFDTLGQPIEHVAIDGLFCTLIRDIAIIDVTTSRNWAYQGWPVNINVTVKNKGNMKETFWLAVYYDENLIETVNVTDLAPNEERIIFFEWNTTGIPEGNYTIKAEAETLPYEINVDDNLMIDGSVWIMTKIHDIAITDLYSPYIVYQGWIVNITLTIRNNGVFSETFMVQILVNDILIENLTITRFSSGGKMNISLLWNTQEVTPCSNYTITARVPILPYEFNLTNNELTHEVKVRYMGDVNGDGEVNTEDILAVAVAFGAHSLSPNWDPTLDLNQDQKINIKDIYLIAVNFGKGCK